MARIKEQVALQQRAARPVELLSPDRDPEVRARACTHAFPRRHASVSAARRRVHAHLRACDLPGELCDLAELVVSELVTNAVLRTESSVVSCTAQVFAHGVRVAVDDEGPADAPPSGHGMFLVDRVAGSWGTLPGADGRGRTVWASVCLADAESGRAER
ncbi:ATP-binding protein [Streptomyces sp. 8L]|uniref:ATP-binding protein n=1 Tax=Streptomyces sp. 8L TaxID=2877242 RepID=UPI001CD602F5|nr:ATP-binding protein [Streptomyces sp. 8L]MCA1220436.1 ATP-binding protein [Streptomyces sp. 8L]